jgi:two-component system CheB/CheR fusion protein
VATHLYRIAQEAVANALKHGRPSRVQIVLAATAKRIVLTVKDDGLGFPAVPSTRKGMGIRIMQYRAEMIGGVLTLQKGTERGGAAVICTLPRQGREFVNQKLYDC